MSTGMQWGCLGLAVSFGIGVVLRGWVLAQLWAWFVVPFGVSAITISWALGLSTFTYFLAGHETKSDDVKPTAEALFKASFKLIGYPLMCLAFGYLWAWTGGML